MRKILLQLMLLPLLMFSACSDDDKGDSTIIIAKDQQNQTAFADDTDKTIRFTAIQDWRTEVDYTGTKATDAAEKWVTLDPPSGEAGEVTVKVTLGKNFTGVNRRAVIKIICGGTTITVIIEQKAETENGEIPDEEPNLPEPGPHPDARRIAEVRTYEDGDYRVFFNYDDKGRITKYYMRENGSEQNIYEYTYVYESEERITEQFTGRDEGYILSGNLTYTLENGRITGATGTQKDNEDNTPDEVRIICEYDTEGQMIKWMDNNTYKINTDVNTDTGQGTEVFSKNVAVKSGSEMTTWTYTWKDGVITAASEGWKNIIDVNCTYEYYSEEELRYMPLAVDIVSWVGLELLWNHEPALSNYFGKIPGRYVKKVVVSSPDNHYDGSGTALYRYETDDKGYITKIYRKWTPKNGTSTGEYLDMEFIYE